MAISPPRSPRLVVGNWKMNGGPDHLRAAAEIGLAAAGGGVEPRIALCPPATLLHRLSEVLKGSGVMTGGQDCHVEASGAFTGEVAAGLLVEAGARVVILGHSERRVALGEDDALVRRKALSAVEAGLEPIVCVGETWTERQDGRTLDVVRAQVRRSIPAELAAHPFAVAYEPIWAIGTGERPSANEIALAHEAIRRELTKAFPDAMPPILYGGSVTPDGVATTLAVPEVGGVLVGGASLRADSFLAIVGAARAADHPTHSQRLARCE
jgi:triosephosphate isomerase